MVNGFVHPAFAEVAAKFSSMFRRPEKGGGSLAVRVHGQVVVDIWDGWCAPDGRDRWGQDTMSICFSTTKGVITTLLHRVLEQRDLPLDVPVATYWPEFGQAGKETILLPELLGHAGGMHRIRGLRVRPEELLDHRRMASILAAAPADAARRGSPGYHALTYGWLVSGLLEAITGEDPRVTLQREMTQPLGLDGMGFGAPVEQRHRIAPLFPRLDFDDKTIERLARGLGAVAPARGLRDAAMIPGFASLVFGDPRLFDTVMGSVNGVFTARSLASMYGALAGDGSQDGYQLLSPERVRRIGKVQYRKRDFVLGLPMRWRMGYHQAFTGLRGRPRKAFGHFGAGGSGGWADPETGVSLGFVTNRMGSTTTPVGDARLVRLGGSVIGAARAAA